MTRVKHRGEKRVRAKTSKTNDGTKVMTLPTKMLEPEQDFSKYIAMLYGQSGIGKTTALAEWPSSVFLATEPGTLGLKRWEIPADGSGIHSWEEFVAAIDLLVETKDDPANKFKTVAIDTWDKAYDLCMDFTCRELGIAHVSEDRTGKSDRSGKGWTTLKGEFTFQVLRIVNAGYGLTMTSHSKVVTITRHGGDEYDLIQPSCSGQALDVAKKITDCIFYCEYAKNSEGDRVIITQGDDLVLAKGRSDPTSDGWPKYLPMPKNKVYETILAAFQGKHLGIAAGEMVISKRAAEPAKTSIKLDKAKKKGVSGNKRKKILRKK